MTKIIAELSGNHGGSFERCLEMIIAAKHCGCWAAKFQYYEPGDLPDFDPKLNFPVPFWWLPEMFGLAKRLGITLFASIFHERAYRELAPYTSIFKIASPESTRLTEHRYDMLRYAAGVRWIVSSGHKDFWVMKYRFPGAEMLFCKAGYPAIVNLEDIKFMRDHAAGFSDHTRGIMDSLAMAAAGAKYIEKHFKLDDNCVDAAFSINPNEMKTLCELTK